MFNGVLFLVLVGKKGFREKFYPTVLAFGLGTTV